MAKVSSSSTAVFPRIILTPEMIKAGSKTLLREIGTVADVGGYEPEMIGPFVENVFRAMARAGKLHVSPKRS